MDDRRFTERYPKKIPLKFRFGSFMEKGKTENISSSGMLIKTPMKHVPRIVIRIEFKLPKNLIVRIDGETRWKGDFSSRWFRMFKKNGLGIRIMKFHSGEQIYKELIRDLQERRA